MLIIKYKEGSAYKSLNPFFTNVTCKLVLNEAGEFSFDYPAGDILSEKLTDYTEIQIIDTNYFFSGLVLTVTNDESGTVPTIKVQGSGLMIEFANDINLPNIAYQNVPYEDLLDPSFTQTIIRPNTWQTVVEPTVETFTYLSSLQVPLALFGIVKERIGYHFRYIGDRTTPRRIEFGQFGDVSPARVRKLPKDYLSTKENLLVVKNGGITLTRKSDALLNVLYPLGGGGDNGVNQLTLRDVDASVIDPAYPIYVDTNTPNTDAVYNPAIYSHNKTAPNTSEAYYLKDPTSITTYGREIKRPIVFSDIYPVASAGTAEYKVTDADRVRAANELYKAAKQYLIEHKDIKKTYTVDCFGDGKDLDVGDVVNIKYKGMVRQIAMDGAESYTYLDINENLYLVSYTVTFTENQTKEYTLELSNIPKKDDNDSQVITDLVQQVQTGARQRKGSVTTYPVYFTDSFDNLFPTEFLLWIPNETVYVDYLKLKVRLKPFRAYSKAVQGGGATTSSTSSGGGSVPSSSSGGSHSHTVSIPNHSHAIGSISAVGDMYPGGSGFPGSTSAFSSTFHFVGGQNIGVYAISSGGSQSSGSGGGAFPSSSSAGTHAHTVSIPSHTHNVTLPNHTHAIQFGIFDDTTPPTGVKIFIDGVDYSPQLGTYAAFGYFPSSAGENFDLLEAAANLGHLDSLITPGEHVVRVQCASGRGRIELSIYNQFFLSSR